MNIEKKIVFDEFDSKFSDQIFIRPFPSNMDPELQPCLELMRVNPIRHPVMQMSNEWR